MQRRSRNVIIIIIGRLLEASSSHNDPVPIQTACPGQSCCLCLPKGVECIWETGFVAFQVFSSHVPKKCKKKKERKKEKKKQMCESRAKLLFCSSNPILLFYCSRCRCHRYRRCFSFQSVLVYSTSMCFELLIASRPWNKRESLSTSLLDWHHIDMVCLALLPFSKTNTLHETLFRELSTFINFASKLPCFPKAIKR